MTIRQTSRWCLAAIVAIAASVACYHHAKQPTFRSNFADVRIAGGQIVTAQRGEPYSGTLIARDHEISELAKLVLAGMPGMRIKPDELGGLILIVPVDKGLLSGHATLRADLRSPRLSREISRRGDPAAAQLAHAVGATVVVAEATLRGGKLDGTAAVFEPAPSKPGPSKIAEVQFRGGVLHGSALEYFPGEGQAKRKLSFESGVQSGPQQWFHRNGKLAREAIYRDGKPHGEMTEHFADGANRARSTFVRGEPVGKKEAWFPTGKRQLEVVFEGDARRTTEWYSNGKVKLTAGPDGEVHHPPEGVIEEYHGDGALRSRARYVDGVMHGPFEIYYSTGQKWKAGTFDRGKQTGAYREWWKNGRQALECQYVAGERDGSFRRWYASGVLWESTQYAAGKLTGPYRKWWKNGAPAHVYAYSHGKLDGDYRMYYDNGAKWAIGSYVNGKPQGTMQRWFPDGRLGYIMHHKNGRPDGEYLRWYADGKPRLIASYVAGHLDGEFRNWLEDGKLYELATYKRGVKLATTRAPAQR